jgi:excisionase family DNA binding protein
MTSSERLLVPVRDAHCILGIGRSKFYDLVSEGRIPLVKLGSKSLVPMTALKAFVESLTGAKAA